MSDTKDSGYVFHKERLPILLDLLMAEYRLIAPVKNDIGIDFRQIKNSEDVCLDYHNTDRPPKGFFLPQAESLMTFNPLNNSIQEGAVSDKPAAILFGVRPCDASAISHLDRVFIDDEPEDPYYRKYREAYLIISLACSEPQPTCFCTSVNCRPDAEKGADIMMHALNGRYYIKGITCKGAALIAGLVDHLKPATAQDIEEKNTLADKAISMVKSSFDCKAFRNKMEDFDASWWEDISRKCLGCGVCTYLCPTCHCFDITDESGRHQGKRIRTWDSCMYPLFTLHASGHNPRKGQKERIRQRIMHKFNYAFKYYQEVFCVGCGRCILQCPVNFDIRQVIKRITEAS
jgi:sulfhydrogenase subunit beta (sulfur reductase)